MPRPSHPNIVIICSDQHRAAALGAYGNRVCRTPNLDRLAAQGTLIERCYAQNPVCSPQRASLMTGRLSRNTGVMRNGIALRRDLPTLAGVLAGAGYRTAAVGKLHLTPQGEGVPTASPESPYYGFQHLDSVEDNRVGPYLDWVLANFPEYAGYSIGCLFNIPTAEAYWRGRRDLRSEYLQAREKFVKPLEISPTCNWGFGHYSPLPEEAHQNTWIANRACDQIDGHDAPRPLLLWVGFVDPHNPFDPPARFRDMYPVAGVESPIRQQGEEAGWSPHHHALYQGYFNAFTESDWRTLRALYYGSVTFMDQAIGRILARLEQKLDMRNTVIIYTSDHGEILGDHGICGKCAYHYDSCIRVPMIGRWDGHWQAGVRQREIVELTDLMPTLLAAAGIDRQPVMDGRSFEPLLAKGNHDTASDRWAPRDHAYSESYSGAPEDPTPSPHHWAKTVRTDRWRATFYPDPGHGELFDMENDPCELRNLWHEASSREVIEQHRRILLSRMMLMDYPLPSSHNGV